MALVRYRCCICGENIDENSKLDPCGISIISNLNRPESEQLEQVFFSHYECFQGTLESDLCAMMNLEDSN